MLGASTSVPTLRPTTDNDDVRSTRSRLSTGGGSQARLRSAAG
jgi:hypothetical protein